MLRSDWNRRKFIKTGISAAAGLIFSGYQRKASAASLDPGRRLSFYNIHTHEKLDVCYFQGGEYLNSELETVNRFFRDFRNGEVKVIDIFLLDLLHAISLKAPQNARIYLISGYRSPETNEKLRKNGGGVASNSLHLKGQAADIRIPEMKTESLRQVAIDLRAGGVGFYPKSDFVHVDIGRIRCW